MASTAYAGLTASGNVIPESDPENWTDETSAYIGYTGTGALSITDKATLAVKIGTIGYLSGSEGTVLVDGEDSKWSNSGNLYIGRSGTGTLEITDKGSVTSTGTYNYIGYSSGSNGTVTVDGTGSNWSNDGYVYVGGSGTGILNISDGGSVSVNGSTIGSSFGSQGTVNVDGAQSAWTNDGNLNVGGAGTGTLKIANKGSVTNTGSSSYSYIGSGSTGNGTVTVDGDGSKWTNASKFYAGYYGTGTLTVTKGGSVTNTGSSSYIGYSEDANGTVNVDGEGSTWTNSGTLYVGKSGTGTLNITHGGLVENTPTATYIGYDSGSVGTVTVDGAKSSWTNTGSLYIGKDGTGILNILNQSTVTITNNTILGTLGSIAFGSNGGTLETGSLYISSLSQLSGAGTINTAGLISDLDISFEDPGSNTLSLLADSVTINLNFDDSSVFGIGYNAEGSLTIKNGVTVASGSGYLGYSEGSTGIATVDGSGSSWRNSGSYFYVGRSGTGILEIINGGSVITTAGSFIGTSSGSSGTVTVTGEGSSWENSGNFYIGNGGTGELTVTNKGSVTTTGTSTFIGTGSESSGSVTIDGEGASWANAGKFYVGNSGTGTLTVTNGGSFTNTGGYNYIGYKAGASGAVAVDGEGSSWTNTGNLYVGDEGTGSLTISNGGSVTSSSAFIGKDTGGIGTVNVDGKDATWTNSSFLYVGDEGTGSLTVSNGGSVTSSGASIGVATGGTGTVRVNGSGSDFSTSNYAIRVGSSGTGYLSVSDDGLVSTSELSINSSSITSVDVSSQVNVGTGENSWTGQIANEGTIRLVAGAGAASGEYVPMNYGTITGEGTVQALGGKWNADNHTITVADAVKATTSGETMALDLKDNQRALLTMASGLSAGAGFLGTDDSTEVNLKISVSYGDAYGMLNGIIYGTDEEILSAWSFSISGSDYTVDTEHPVYLSLDAGSASDILDLTIWCLTTTGWEEFDAVDLAFDGTYASFTTTALGIYAVTGIASVPLPGSLCLLAAGLLAMAGLPRTRQR